MPIIKLFPVLESKIEEIAQLEISEERKKILQPLIDYIISKKNKKEGIQLNFICTHNSRRSQLAQVWAKCISEYWGLQINSFSGGTEETEFHLNAIAALERAGFIITKNKGRNPKIKVSYSSQKDAITCYSKVYDAHENPKDSFAAVMTCSHADENCPFIPGAEDRIALDYQDPKAFDGTAMESQKYDERSNQIASEMFYVFNQSQK